MRDLIFVSLFLPLILLSLAHPFSGLLTFGWIAFAKPQSQLWSFAADFPFNLVIAVSTVIGWTLSKEKKGINLDLTFILIILLVGLAGISTYFSLSPEKSNVEFSRLLKVFVFLILLNAMMTTRVRVHSYIWIMAFAIGFLGANGGVLFIVTAGGHELVGPLRSEIADRNTLALAMLLAIPLMNYLRQVSYHRWVRVVLFATMIMTVLAILSTYSRGGFIGLVAMAFFLWWKSKGRILAMLAFLVIAYGLFYVAPDKWKQRIGTIETAASEDSSFRHRLQSWHAHFNAAVDRPLIGAGLYGLQTTPAFFRYAPAKEIIDVKNQSARAAHSIYFQVLGELGFVGFFIYVALITTGYYNAFWITQHAHNFRDLRWMCDLARMIQVSMVAFCVAGAALSMAFYDYFLSLLVILAAIRRMATAELAEISSGTTTFESGSTGRDVKPWWRTGSGNSARTGRHRHRRGSSRLAPTLGNGLADCESVDQPANSAEPVPASIAKIWRVASVSGASTRLSNRISRRRVLRYRFPPG